MKEPNRFHLLFFLIEFQPKMAPLIYKFLEREQATYCIKSVVNENAATG